MPSASELERADQDAIGEPDRDLRYELKKLGVEFASMADRAALEIRRLQTRNTSLAAQAEAYEVIRSITGLLRGDAMCAEEDFSYRLERRAEELRSEHA